VGRRSLTRVQNRTGLRSDRGHKFLGGLGITSDVVYLAGMLSIGASIAAWIAFSRMEPVPGEKAAGVPRTGTPRPTRPRGVKKL
jgi:hypothetical protein